MGEIQILCNILNTTSEPREDLNVRENRCVSRVIWLAASMDVRNRWNRKGMASQVKLKIWVEFFPIPLKRKCFVVQFLIGIFVAELLKDSSSKCIWHDDDLITPNEFQKRGGKQKQRNWKQSIKIHGGKPI